MLDRLRRGDGDEERARIGVTDVFGRVHDHAARDEARVFAAFEHRGEVVDGGIGVAAADRLDERRREVVVRVCVLVVDHWALARCVLDVLLGQLALRGLRGELDDVERGARIAAGALHDQLDDLVRHGRTELVGAAPHDDREILWRERRELVHLRA